MKKTILSMTVVMMLSGCATTSQFSTETAQQKQERQTSNRSAATKGFGIGCVGGALAGLFAGNSSDRARNMAAGCVAAGAVTAGTAWYTNNQAQLKAANDLAQQARAAGAQATVNEKTVQVQDEATGEMRSVATLENMEIILPPNALSNQTDLIKQMIRQSATYANTSKVPVEITLFHSSEKNRVFVESELNKTLANKGSLTQRSHANDKLILSPVPVL